MELMQISAGRGPIECSWAVWKVFEKLVETAEKRGIFFIEGCENRNDAVIWCGWSACEQDRVRCSCNACSIKNSSCDNK